MFVPINIPSSSKIDEVINGYVLTSPFVKTFLLAGFLIIELFSPVGIHARSNSSCLKFAFLVCNPILSNKPSILFI